MLRATLRFMSLENPRATLRLVPLESPQERGGKHAAMQAGLEGLLRATPLNKAYRFLSACLLRP